MDQKMNPSYIIFRNSMFPICLEALVKKCKKNPKLICDLLVGYDEQNVLITFSSCLKYSEKMPQITCIGNQNNKQTVSSEF